MSEITVQQAREGKQRLDHEINRLLNEYIKQYNCQIARICLGSIQQDDRDIAYYVDVEVKL